MNYFFIINKTRIKKNTMVLFRAAVANLRSKIPLVVRENIIKYRIYLSGSRSSKG